MRTHSEQIFERLPRGEDNIESSNKHRCAVLRRLRKRIRLHATARVLPGDGGRPGVRAGQSHPLPPLADTSFLHRYLLSQSSALLRKQVRTSRPSMLRPFRFELACVSRFDVFLTVFFFGKVINQVQPGLLTELTANCDDEQDVASLTCDAPRVVDRHAATINLWRPPAVRRLLFGASTSCWPAASFPRAAGAEGPTPPATAFATHTSSTI